MMTDLRDDLRAAQSLLAAGDIVAASQKVDAALKRLDADRLLTTTEATEVLGIRSVNTLKALVRVEGIQIIMHGNRMMLPLSEVERIQETARVRGIRAADRAHDETEDMGVLDGLTQEEMDVLSASRPGSPPWQCELGPDDCRQSA